MKTVLRPGTFALGFRSALLSSLCLACALVVPVTVFAATRDNAFAALVGQWHGTLTYLDYGSSQRVELPATIENLVSPSQAGNVLISKVAFTDPGWIARSVQLTTIGSVGTTVRSVSTGADGFEEENFALDQFDTTESGWRMVMSRTGKDDDKPAEFRVTNTLSGNSFVMTKEVRYPDDPKSTWFVRNEVSVARASVSEEALVGTWKVDLRPTPDAAPYFQTFVVRSVGDGFEMEFYGTPATNIHINKDWGHVEFAFTTEDGSGVYHTSGRLLGERLEGRTHSLGRNFLSVWTAER